MRPMLLTLVAITLAIKTTHPRPAVVAMRVSAPGRLWDRAG